MTQPDPVTARIIKERRPINTIPLSADRAHIWLERIKKCTIQPRLLCTQCLLSATGSNGRRMLRTKIPRAWQHYVIPAATSCIRICRMLRRIFCRAGTGAAASTAQRAHQGRQSVRQGIHNVGTIGPVSCCNTLLTVSQPRGTPHGSPHLCVIYYSKRCAIPARACRRHPAYIGSYGSTNRGNPSANIHVVKIHDAGSIRKYHVNNRNTLHL